MATYKELYDLMATESEVKNKVEVALVVAAKAVYDEVDTTPNHAKRLAWASGVLNDFKPATQKVFPILVASYKDQTIVAIKGATDTAIQSVVNAHINFLAGV